MFERGSGGFEVVRLLAAAIVLSASLFAGTESCMGADAWGGSLGITSDYILRGISRSNEQAALQLDLHYLKNSGFVAGLYASDAQYNPHAPRDVELDAYLGFAWTVGVDWRGKALVSHYAYPWNRAGTEYDYDELTLDAAFREWLNVAVVYSPDAPRYSPYSERIHVSSQSAEVSVQRPLWRKLSATAGVGYSHYGGPDAQGYAYWSVGAALDLAPVALALSYINTSAGAKLLFYNAAADDRWTGTVIWRF